MSFLGLIPLLVAAFTALATVVYVLQRVSLAQSTCVQGASALSEALGRDLTALMRLNVRARTLRHQRQAAEAARDAAVASLNGPAVAAAEAVLAAIRMAQIALDARQRAILIGAWNTRRRGQAEFQIHARRLRAERVRVAPRVGPALAVRARQPSELAPEYEEVENFAHRQRQSFAFDVETTPGFARGLVPRSTQPTSCATTLEKKGHLWRNSIVEASAPLSSQSRQWR